MTGEVELYTPHPGQDRVHSLLSAYPYVVVAAGRRWGKTELSVNWLVFRSLSEPRHFALYMTPHSDQRRLVFEKFARDYGEAPFMRRLDRSSMTAELANSSVVSFKLASVPACEAVRGGEYDTVICDEFAFWRDDVFESIVQPTMASRRRPSCLVVSTPKGRGLFHRLYERGRSDEAPAWASYRAKSSDNPLVSQEFLDEVRATVPKDVYEQEYEARFVDDASAVFRGADVAAAAARVRERKGRLFGGVDVGLKGDRTVLTVLDETGALVASVGFSGGELFDAAARVAKVARPLKLERLVVETNTYQGMAEELRRLGLHTVEGEFTTPQRKRLLVDELSLALESGQLALGGHPESGQYESELSTFEYVYDRSTRNISYGAPPGAHDDYVMSLAFANLARVTARPRMEAQVVRRGR